jgi:hypothetical protein
MRRRAGERTPRTEQGFGKPGAHGGVERLDGNAGARYGTGVTELDAAAARREARRQTWAGQLFRPGEEEAMAEADTRFWLAIPPDERANVVWQLSVEVFGLAGTDEPGLPRSAWRLVRR